MNDFDADEETRRLLKAVDPAHSLPPADADALASLLEDTMNSPAHDSRSTSAPKRSRLLVLGGAAAAMVAIAAGVVIGARGSEEDPTTSSNAQQTVTELSGGEAALGKCMPPTAELVANQEIAFEGTVTEISDEVVTLEVDEFYQGTPTDLVTVTKPDLGMSEMPVDFQLGQTYLVGATDGVVPICGTSGLATEDLKALYAEAFGK